MALIVVQQIGEDDEDEDKDRNDNRESSKEDSTNKTFLYYFQLLGMASGMIQILASYIIRRGMGNELDGTYIIPISAGLI